MTNFENTRGSFTISSEIIDEYNWICGGLLENIVGITCTLYYPPKIDECSNCFRDPETGRSSNIYKADGPQEFTNFTLCPLCHGRGLLTAESTEDITLRVYYNPSYDIMKGFINMKNIDWGTSQDVVMIIGYMKDLPKIENATKILLSSDIQGIRRYFVQRKGECIPWGLDKKRFFIGYFTREGGG